MRYAACEACAALGYAWLNTQTGAVSPATCNRYRECRQAAERYAYRFKKRIVQPECEWRQMITLTQSSESGQASAETLNAQKHAWHKLLRWLQRKYGPIQWVAVREQGMKGRLHLHCLWSLEITQAELEELASAAGFGIKCKIAPVYNRPGAIKYVAEPLLTIAIDLPTSWPKGIRLYSTSRSVPALPPPPKGKFKRIARPLDSCYKQ